MSSEDVRDVSMHKNMIVDEEAQVEVIAKGGADALATEVKPLEQVNEQEPPAELTEDELAIVAGAGFTAQLARFGKSEFGRTGIAGVAGLSSGVTSYAIVHAVLKKENG